MLHTNMLHTFKMHCTDRSPNNSFISSNDMNTQNSYTKSYTIDEIFNKIQSLTKKQNYLISKKINNSEIKKKSENILDMIEKSENIDQDEKIAEEVYEIMKNLTQEEAQIITEKQIAQNKSYCLIKRNKF